MSLNTTIHKHLWPVRVDKNDVILECHIQFYDIIKYKQFSIEEKKKFITSITVKLTSIVQKHLEKGSCSSQQAKVNLLNIDLFSVSHFKGPIFILLDSCAVNTVRTLSVMRSYAKSSA